MKKSHNITKKFLKKLEKILQQGMYEAAFTGDRAEMERIICLAKALYKIEIN